MVADIFMQDEITFVEDTHQYFNKTKEQYTSVSKVLERLKVPFDREGISRRMAATRSEELGIPFEQALKDLLGEWDGSKDSSIGKGNHLHTGMYKYSQSGIITPGLEKPIAFMQNIFKQYYRFYPEVLLHSHKYKVAGTTDLILQRQKIKKPVLDFMDYKTNESKGIQYDSIGRKDEAKHYNRYFLPPFDHLENCNYVLYSLQLSIYAFLATEDTDNRVGKLAIIFFDNEFNPQYIPVPYMYYEAKELCQLNTVIKPLPITGIINGKPVSEINHPAIKEVDKIFRPAFDPTKIEEDW